MFIAVISMFVVNCSFNSSFHEHTGYPFPGVSFAFCKFFFDGFIFLFLSKFSVMVPVRRSCVIWCGYESTGGILVVVPGSGLTSGRVVHTSCGGLYCCSLVCSCRLVCGIRFICSLRSTSRLIQLFGYIWLLILRGLSSGFTFKY